MYKEIFVILSAFILMHTNALPRDSSVVITETVSPIADTISSKVKEPSNESFSETGFYAHQVICKYDASTDEPLEDSVCQDHCLPKGYSFGLCVRGKCSCV
ncbi:uncharacterized protein LOC126969180 [Leptidea sinapis]|uniref:uncharacterized protein LOC126969180 n=1 Tax=Leptidea sinapis TaxID=189913 RepID=UPI0021381191|nr:uncharacterized protein LOC126969180 [Leptidea sinapis]